MEQAGGAARGEVGGAASGRRGPMGTLQGPRRTAFDFLVGCAARQGERLAAWPGPWPTTGEGAQWGRCKAHGRQRPWTSCTSSFIVSLIQWHCLAAELCMDWHTLPACRARTRGAPEPALGPVAGPRSGVVAVGGRTRRSSVPPPAPTPSGCHRDCAVSCCNTTWPRWRHPEGQEKWHRRWVGG